MPAGRCRRMGESGSAPGSQLSFSDGPRKSKPSAKPYRLRSPARQSGLHGLSGPSACTRFALGRMVVARGGQLFL